MRELLDIVAAFDELAGLGKSAALATVVGVEGSAYRSPGARMLIAEDGRTWGGVSGGCLERDVMQRALGVIASGIPMLHRYDTADDEHLATGVSTGCGGVVQILIQRVTAGAPGVIPLMASVVRDRQTLNIATIIRASGAWMNLVGIAQAWHELPAHDEFCVPHGPEAHATKLAPCSALPVAITDAIADAEGDGQIEIYDCISHAKATLFIETIAPPQELIVFGAGPDVVPLVDIATTLGWRITVVAAPPATHAAERLRKAHRIVVTGSDAPAAGVEVPRGAAVVVMTHNVARDRAILANLQTRPAYLGILGPTHRTERILDGLAFRIDDQSVYAPVGLDIGAQAPQEIALSIIAEITAWRTGRHGGPLRERDGPIHAPIHTPLHTPARVPARASLTRLIPSGAV